MTFVVAVNYLQGFVVYADTRVSFGPTQFDVKHGVQKLLFLHDENRHRYGVLGYCGSLEIVKHITNVMRHRFASRHASVSSHDWSFMIMKWIKRASSELSKHQFKMGHAEFMFCTSDPGTTSSELSVQHFYKYRVTGPGKVVRIEVNERIAMIGSGIELEADIRPLLLSDLQFSQDTHGDHFRATMIANLLSETFETVSSKTVGGVWQYIGYSPVRGRYHCYLPPNFFDNPDFTVSDENRITVVKDQTANKDFIIYPVDMWTRSECKSFADDNSASQALLHPESPSL